METFINFMNGALGRFARLVLGLAPFFVDLFALGGGTAGYVVALIGLAPIALGMWGRRLPEIVAPEIKHA